MKATAPKRARRSRRPTPTTPDFRAYAATATALARLDLDGHIRDLNHAFAELFDIKPADLLGREFLELLHPEDSASVRHGGLTSFSGGTVRADLRCIRGDGRVIWARTAISLAKDDEGMPAFLVVSLADVGDLKELLFDRATGLPTRRLFDDRLGLALRAAARAGEPLAVATVRFSASDADKRGLVDRYADHVTDCVAAAIGAQVRNSDTVARLGQLEVALVLPGVTALGAREVLARAGVPGFHAIDLAEEDVNVSAFAGVAAYPEDGASGDVLLAAAAPESSEARGGMALSISIALPDVTAPNAGQARSEMDVRVRALEPVSLFFSVTDQVLHRIARYTGREIAAAGEQVLVDENRPSLRVVEEGLFEVLSNDGADVAVMMLSPGDFLATDRALGEGPLGLRLRAASDSRMLVLGEEALNQVAPEGSSLRGALRDAAGQRNRQIRKLGERTRTVANARTATSTAIYSTKAAPPWPSTSPLSSAAGIPATCC
jgi:PAS domain S-box-containing protein